MKNGVGNMNKLSEELKQECVFSCSSETQFAVASNLAKEVSQKVNRWMGEIGIKSPDKGM